MKYQSIQANIVQGQSWEIRDGDKVLVHLPAALSDSEVIGIMELIKNVEKDTHERSAELTRGAMRGVYEPRIAGMQEHIERLTAHNDMLAQRLEDKISGVISDGND